MKKTQMTIISTKFASFGSETQPDITPDIVEYASSLVFVSPLSIHSSLNCRREDQFKWNVSSHRVTLSSNVILLESVVFCVFFPCLVKTSIRNWSDGCSLRRVNLMKAICKWKKKLHYLKWKAIYSHHFHTLNSYPLSTSMRLSLAAVSKN